MSSAFRERGPEVVAAHFDVPRPSPLPRAERRRFCLFQTLPLSPFYLSGFVNWWIVQPFLMVFSSWKKKSWALILQETELNSIVFNHLFTRYGGKWMKFGSRLHDKGEDLGSQTDPHSGIFRRRFREFLSSPPARLFTACFTLSSHVVSMETFSFDGLP